MSRKLIIDGNAVYEIDEKCMLKNKLGELKDKKITSDEKRAEQSGVTGKPNRLKRYARRGMRFFRMPHLKWKKEQI